MLLELLFLKVNLVLQFNNSLSQSQLRSNCALEGDADANRELKIIKAEIGVVKPLINEIVQDSHIEKGQIIEDLRLLLLLISCSRASLPNSSSEDRSMASDSFLRTTAGVSA